MENRVQTIPFDDVISCSHGHTGPFYHVSHIEAYRKVARATRKAPQVHWEPAELFADGDNLIPVQGSPEYLVCFHRDPEDRTVCSDRVPLADAEIDWLTGSGSLASRMPTPRCPFCGYRLTDLLRIDSTDVDAELAPGSWLACISCGEAIVFDDLMELRKPTEHERAELFASVPAAREVTSSIAEMNRRGVPLDRTEVADMTSIHVALHELQREGQARWSGKLVSGEDGAPHKVWIRPTKT